MKTSLRVIVAAMFAVGISVSLATAQSIRKELYHAQKTGRALLKYSEVLNRNTVTIISGTPAGTYLAVAYDMSAVLDDGDNLRVLAVAGKGSVQNVRDILHLRGVDMGIVQSDVMAYFKQNGELGANVDERLVYITKLYNEEMHLVASADIKDIKDLAGKKVNFAEVGSGTQFSSRLIFGFLGIKVEEVNMGQTDALVKVKSGEIAATVFIAGRPASVFAKLPKDPDLKLLAVPYTSELETNDYFPSTLSSQDYPGLIPDGQSVDTIAVGAVLAVYNWPSDHERHRRTANFIDALFGKFAEFQKPPRHPKWKEVNLAATLKGWIRFPTAQQWLDRAAATAGPPVIDTALAGAQDTRAAPNDPAERNRLFDQFLEWYAQQGLDQAAATSGTGPSVIDTTLERGSLPSSARINVGSYKAARQSQQAQCDYSACAAKYQSFNCTYQPYGGGTRRQCEKSATSARMVSAPPAPEVAGQPRRGQCNYDACAQVYSSFRREDCTYQPNNGSPRKVCQH